MIAGIFYFVSCKSEQLVPILYIIMAVQVFCNKNTCTANA